MKLLFIIFFLLSTLQADTLIDTFIQKQLRQQASIILDVNSTKSSDNTVLQARYDEYSSFLNTLLQNKKQSLMDIDLNKKQRFYLHRKIELNKQRGNKFSVLRDRITSQRLEVEDILKEMLTLLITSTYEISEKNYANTLEEALHNNRASIKALPKNFEKSLSFCDPSHKIIIQAEKNLIQLNALIFLNNDLRNYIRAYKDSIYQNSLYSTFGLSRLKRQIQDSTTAKKLDPYLTRVNIDSPKLLLIIIILIITISASKGIYFLANLLVNKTDYKVTEIHFILEQVRNVVRALILLFGLQLIFDIFLGIGGEAEESNKFFEMSYIILMTFLLYKVINTLAIVKMQSIERRTQTYRNEVINLGIKGLKFLLFLISFLVILKIYGVNLTAILSGLGIGSLAIAFAAKDTLSNFFGSLSILLDNPFSQGDSIEVDGKSGTVIEIGIRSTTIRTFDNAMVTIPNLTLANSSVVNWSKRTIGRRIKMNVGVTYESDFKDIESAVNDIYKMLLNHKDVASDKTEFTNSIASIKLISQEDQRGVKRSIAVYLDNFSASSIDILVYCFAKSVDWKDWLAVKEDLMYKIGDILEKNNLDFAYPALTVHMQGQTEEKN